MSLRDLFTFESKEQAAQKQAEYERTMFPLGQPHRNAAAAVLREVLPSVAREEERLFVFLCCKEIYLARQSGDDTPEQVRAKLATLRVRQHEEQNAILALLILEEGIASMAEYPTPSDVRRRAGEI